MGFEIKFEPALLKTVEAVLFFWSKVTSIYSGLRIHFLEFSIQIKSLDLNGTGIIKQSFKFYSIQTFNRKEIPSIFYLSIEKNLWVLHKY